MAPDLRVLLGVPPPAQHVFAARRWRAEKALRALKKARYAVVFAKAGGGRHGRHAHWHERAISCSLRIARFFSNHCHLVIAQRRQRAAAAHLRAAALCCCAQVLLRTSAHAAARFHEAADGDVLAEAARVRAAAEEEPRRGGLQ